MRFGLVMAGMLLFGGCVLAKADTTTQGGYGNFSGSGTLTGIGNANGSVTVTGMEGTFVTGLISPANNSGAAGFDGNDNLIFPNGSSLVDHKGLAFTAANSDTFFQVDLVSDADGGYKAKFLDSDGYSHAVPVTLTFQNTSGGTDDLHAALLATDVQTYSFIFGAVNPTSATPEPSSIALLGTGLLGAAGLLHRRRS